MASTTIKLCVALALIVCLSRVGAIMNAKDATQGQFPYVASIYQPEHLHHACAGAIVSDRYIISVAYCLDHYVDNPSKVIAYLGAWKLDRNAISTKIAEIKIHEGFIADRKLNDIAFAKTADRIIFTEFIKPIALPTKDIPDENGISAVVSGFGSPFAPEKMRDVMARSTILKYQGTTTITMKLCTERFSHASDLDLWSSAIKDLGKNFICTTNQGGNGLNVGDIGNPLVVNDTLVGIASWFVEFNSNYPNVYTKVYSHLDWIVETMELGNN